MLFLKELRIKKTVKNLKPLRTKVIVSDITENGFIVRGTDGKKFPSLYINVIDAEDVSVGDAIYLSKSMESGIRENCFYYTLSASFGMEGARAPHDILINPDEFVIVERTDGETVVLQHLYG